MQRDIKDIFGAHTVSKTTGPYSAVALTRQAIKEGAELVLAIGGDGTFNEAVNGFIEEDRLINPEAALGFVTSGTGGDIRKQFDWPDPDGFRNMLELIAEGQTRHLDVGKLIFQDDEDQTAHRYFLNESTFGLGGAVSQAVNRSKIAKLFGGSFAFYWHALSQGVRYKNQKIRLQLDDDFDQEFSIILVAVCNCQFLGGGMHMAPKADPQDGLFDILIGHDITSFELNALAKEIYKGTHVNHPKIITRQARRVVATPLPDQGPVRIEADGETSGKLSSVYEMLPQLIPVRG
jgi:YegS/Rv2252/BmrU family lipid kinase